MTFHPPPHCYQHHQTECHPVIHKILFIYMDMFCPFLVTAPWLQHHQDVVLQVNLKLTQVQLFINSICTTRRPTVLNSLFGVGVAVVGIWLDQMLSSSLTRKYSKIKLNCCDLSCNLHEFYQLMCDVHAWLNIASGYFLESCRIMTNFICAISLWVWVLLGSGKEEFPSVCNSRCVA